MKRILLSLLGVMMFAYVFAQVDVAGDTTGDCFPFTLLLIWGLIFLLLFLSLIGICWILTKWITKGKNSR
ncbi:MAG: hypothetical protein J5524_00910 [Bacteroidaceae bacterium]|nr:hypothetical protein [Bacteroidaceae bacterium]